MIKKKLTPSLIVIFFWIVGLLIINQYFHGYLRHYLYLSIIIAIGYIVMEKIIEDKEEEKDE